MFCISLFIVSTSFCASETMVLIMVLIVLILMSSFNSLQSQGHNLPGRTWGHYDQEDIYYLATKSSTCSYK